VTAESIWVLTVMHRTGRHGRIGVELWARRHSADLAADLYQYVKDWWADEIEEAIPTIPEAAIRKYFSAMEGKEWWEMTELDLR